MQYDFDCRDYGICDMHNDLFTSNLSLARQRKYLLNCLEAGIVSRVVLAAWTSGGQFNTPRSLCALGKRFGGCQGVLFGIEDFGCFASHEFLTEAKPLYVSLTWNYANRYAGGALSDGRLTAYGRELVRACNEQGIFVDTAHLNEHSFFEVLDCAKRVICSHTAAGAVNPHPRNLTDRQIREIASRGGLVGVCLVSDFLSEGKCSSADLVRHIDHVVSVGGIDAVGIGSDFFGTNNLPVDIKDYKSMLIIVEKLRQLGYNENDIKKICHKNFVHKFG